MSGGFIANDEVRLFNAVTLTAAYGGNTTTNYENRSNCGLSLLIKYAADAGSATAYLEFKVEMSYDNTTWIPYGEWLLPSAGVREFDTEVFKVNQNDPLCVLTLDELRGRYFRVKAQEASVTGAFFGTLTMYVYPHAI